jgi:hypothetical protein
MDLLLYMPVHVCELTRVGLQLEEAKLEYALANYNENKQEMINEEQIKIRQAAACETYAFQ